MNKYVEALYEENEESVYYEEMVTGIWKPVATKHKRQSSPPAHSFSKVFVPNEQRKWNCIPPVDCVIKGSLSWSVSKIITKMLRYHGSH